MGPNLTFPAGEDPPPPIPEHELLGLIGTGSSGHVWLAKNALGAFRAVKIVRENSFNYGGAFDREWQGVLKFEPISRSHDGLVDILQVGGSKEAGYFYYVMELADDIISGQVVIQGRYLPRTLSRDIERRGRLPIGECVRTGAAIASALSFLHRHDLLHCDVKPSNIIFVNGFPKLADAGLVSEVFKPGARVGTEGFIAPEGSGTPEADVYSLGKVLYEISTGKDRNEYPELPPDLGETAEDRDVVQFNKIVLRSCRANPRQRFRSAEDLLTALVSFQFCQHQLRKAKAWRYSARLLAWCGLVVALVASVLMVWRVVWLLTHGK